MEQSDNNNIEMGGKSLEDGTKSNDQSPTSPTNNLVLEVEKQGISSESGVVCPPSPTTSVSSLNSQPSSPPSKPIQPPTKRALKMSSVRKMTSSLPSSHRAGTWGGQISLKKSGVGNTKPDTNEKRTNILKEILSTEHAYVSFLSIIIDVYLVKIKEKDIISKDEIELIFSNIESIKSANEEILLKLKERIENINQNQNNQENQKSENNSSNENNNNNNIIIISDIFKEYGPFLKIYSIFVNNFYNNAIKLIKSLTNSNKKFKAYLNECKYTPFAKKLDLNDLLIMVIQRLPRYILLLEELIQYTPVESEEKTNLQSAKDIMKDVASYVNQSTDNQKDKQDPLQVLTRVQQELGPKAGDLIQPHRRLVKSGNLDRLVITTDGIPKKRKIGIYLFNDLIIYSVNKKFWRQLPLSEIWIKARNLEEYESAFEIYSQSLTCIFLTDVETVNWPLLIQDTINSYLENDNIAQEKRKKIIDDIRDQSDLTFEEKQFFFESVSNVYSSLQPNSPNIESGIVNERKKKLEHLLLENTKRNILSDSEDIDDHSSLSDIGKSNRNRKLTNNSDVDNASTSSTTSTTTTTTTTGTPTKTKEKKVNRTVKKVQKPKLDSSGMMGVDTAKQFFAQKDSDRLLHILLMRNNIKKEGYLTKVGAVVKNWKRRWFIMENGYLFYLKHKNSPKQLGTIPLLGSKIDSISIESRSFSIVTKNRTFMLLADSDQEIKEWTKVITEFYSDRQSTVVKYANHLSSIVRSNGDIWMPAIPKTGLSRSTSALSLSVRSSVSTSPTSPAGSSIDLSKRIADFQQKSLQHSSNEDLQRHQSPSSSSPNSPPTSPFTSFTKFKVQDIYNRKCLIGYHHLQDDKLQLNHHEENETDEEEDDSEEETEDETEDDEEDDTNESDESNDEEESEYRDESDIHTDVE